MEAYIDAKKAEEKEDFPTDDEEEEEEEEVEEEDISDSDADELVGRLQKNFLSDSSDG